MMMLEECYWCEGTGGRKGETCPWCDGAGCSPAEPYPGFCECPACFESCGYECEFGNDWHSGPYVHQTRIPCRVCDGTGLVEALPLDFFDLVEMTADGPEAFWI